MKVADTLTRFANARERAFKAAGSLRMTQLSAISKIRNVASMVSGKSESVQLRAVIRLESEIIQIMPHPESRFKNLRANLFKLIQKAHDQSHDYSEAF